MFTFGNTRSEEHLILSRMRAERARKEHEDAQRKMAERISRQRAQRLAKEAADKDKNG